MLRRRPPLRRRCGISPHTATARGYIPEMTDVGETVPDPRNHPETQADERTTLVVFLNFQRETLAWKCADLSAEQLARRAVPCTTMSLLGIVRHMAEVERIWFRVVLCQEPAVPHFYSDEDSDGEFNDAVADDEVVAIGFATWRAEIAYAESFVASASDLDVSGTNKWGETMSLRWILVHMVEEYARHNGHADLLRQMIDGRTGE